MATLYWGGGTGGWNTTNTANWYSDFARTILAGAVPTSADDVIFDSVSNATLYTCTLTTTPVCRSLTIAGPATGNITFAGTVGLSIFGSLTIASTGVTRTYSGDITFNATTTGWTISSGINLANAIVFNGVGGGWSLAAGLTTVGKTTSLNAGSFDTAGFSLTTTGIVAGVSGTSLSFGASTITLSVSNALSGWNLLPGFTFNSGTSTLNLTADVIIPSTYAFWNVNCTFGGSNAISIATNSFNNLTIVPAVGPNASLGTITLSGNITITNALTIAAGATLGAQRRFIKSSALGTARTITSASASLTDVDFQDTTGSSWTGTRLGDCGGNSGITFDIPKTVYWNLAGAQVLTANGWATTQTGSPATTNFPLAQDTAVFTDTAPVAGTILTSNIKNIGTLDFSTRTNTLTLATTTQPPNIYGDIILSSAITLSGTGILTFAGRNTTQTIISAGISFTQPISQTTIGGGVTFADTFVSSNTYTLTNGALNTNFDFTCTTFASTNSNTRSITLGSNTVFLSGTGTVWNLATVTGMALTAGTSTISLTNTSTTARTFAGGGRTYYNFTIAGAGISTLSFTGSNTFNTISSTKTVAHTILFTAATTTTVANWTVTGTVGNVVTIGSVTASSHNLVKTGGGDVSVDYMSISRSNASP